MRLEFYIAQWIIGQKRKRQLFLELPEL